MFKKTMKFDDLDGNEVTQTFYFNYNKKEIAELLEFGQVMKFSAPGSVRDPLEVQMKKLSTPVEESGLSQQENNQQAYEIFQNLILDAYGQKGADNVTFEKNWDLRNYWESHVAFPEMVFEFLADEKLAAEFIEKCLPPRLVEAQKAELREKGVLVSSTVSEMVQEAARRQENPETRVAPGIEAAREALGENPEVEKLAKSVKKVSYTPEDIAAMSDEEFANLDVRGLPQPVVLAAYKRKIQN